MYFGCIVFAVLCICFCITVIGAYNILAKIMTTNNFEKGTRA